MNNQQKTTTFSQSLQSKIDTLKAKCKEIKLGSVTFDSPLILAPLSGICNRPFRLLMEDLGAGGTISELVSCHGINYKNERTVEMLKIDPREKNVGLQLFGEDAEAIAQAAITAGTFNPKFIDINMGCPAKKVVKRGSGSALLKEDTEYLAKFLTTIKKSIKLPLSIKIRSGWNSENINADKIIDVAHSCGVEFVSIHGRTQSQLYKGDADWNLIEKLAKSSPLPLIGNGDLHTPNKVRERLAITNCQALMLGRGPLRNPFIFLESLDNECAVQFVAKDYWEVANRYYEYVHQILQPSNMKIVQIKKIFVWFTAGFPGCAKLRSEIFECHDLDRVVELTQNFFNNLGETPKKIEPSTDFLMGGHG